MFKQQSLIAVKLLELYSFRTGRQKKPENVTFQLQCLQHMTEN